jgi:hypothetical protein
MNAMNDPEIKELWEDPDIQSKLAEVMSSTFSSKCDKTSFDGIPLFE